LAFVKQPPGRCGSTALAEVLAFWGVPNADEKSLAAEAFSPKLGGALNADLVTAARERNLVVRAGRSEVAELRQAVESGYPAVVLITLSPHLLGRKHYLTVKGSDSGRGYLLADDGARPDVVLRPGAFPADWKAAGNWALYCWPPEKAPEWARPGEDLSAGVLLEKAGKSAAAAAAYRRAAAKDAKLWEAHFNLGNLALAQRRFDEAAAAYRQALELRPDEPDILNNLAWAYFSAGQELGQAEEQARRALKMSPPRSAAAARAANTLAAVLVARGRPEEARDLYQRALKEARDAADATSAAEAETALKALELPKK
jgi:tetratricopeptide (TPR) repeat protein